MSVAATVLLAEDEDPLAQGIADLLELSDTGYKIAVIRAVNGRQGLEEIKHRQPDLIISDIMMPKMDGFEFLNQVRQNPQWVHIPFIFLTAKGAKQDVAAGQLTGAELYVTKPFDNQELIDLVKSQLDRAFQLQKHRHDQLHKLKRDVLQLLNHEFRTPLTYVTAYYEMLAESLLVEEGSNLQEYLRGIQVGSLRLTRLVEDLIRLVDLRTGASRATYEQGASVLPNVGEMLHDAGMFRHGEAADKGIALQFEIEPGLPAVFGHSDYLLEIFDRLLDNAIKFTYNRKRKDGQVTVRAWGRDEEVYLAVADNGVGFPEHARHQIFDLFSQYNREKMEQQGSGSGLAIVRGLVELHHGRIEVTSREGVGSQFTVVLPVYDESQSQIESDALPRLATVLLVEDDQFLLEGLCELLVIEEDRFRFRVLSASNGREALTLLAYERPDLIISDVMMPVMDGYQLLTAVRENPAWVHIPFIFLSAKGEQQDIHHGRRQGAEQYITKPYESDELLKLVNTQLDRYFQVQTVVSQDFEELKRGILAMLQPGFKTPLDSVTDYSQQLAIRLELAKTDADLRDSLQGLQEASNRLTRLVEDFMILAELKTGEKGTAFQNRAAPIAVDALLYGICYSENEQWFDLPLQVQLEGELPPIYGDEQALTQLLERVVETAAMLWSREKKGVVYLTAVEQSDSLNVIVSLDGAGFTAAEVEQVIGLLETEDSAALQAIEYGPALTIAKGIAELHGGYLQLENEPDRHCKITLTLPIYVPEKP